MRVNLSSIFTWSMAIISAGVTGFALYHFIINNNVPSNTVFLILSSVQLFGATGNVVCYQSQNKYLKSEIAKHSTKIDNGFSRMERILSDRLPPHS